MELTQEQIENRQKYSRKAGAESFAKLLDQITK